MNKVTSHGGREMTFILLIPHVYLLSAIFQVNAWVKYNSRGVLSGTLGLCPSEIQCALLQRPISGAEGKMRNKINYKQRVKPCRVGFGFLQICCYFSVSWFGVLFLSGSQNHITIKVGNDL